MNIITNILFTIMCCSFISTVVTLVINLSNTLDTKILRTTTVVLISSILLSIILSFIYPEIALSMSYLLSITMKYYALAMLIGIWGFIPMLIVTWIISSLCRLVETMFEKTLKNYNGFIADRIFELGSCLGFIICASSIMLSFVPLVYLIFKTAIPLLFIIIGIHLLLIAINHVEEYIIFKKLHRTMIDLNENIPNDYYKFYSADLEENVYLLDLLSLIHYNFKLILNIIKKEPLKMYF